MPGKNICLHIFFLLLLSAPFLFPLSSPAQPPFDFDKPGPAKVVIRKMGNRGWRPEMMMAALHRPDLSIEKLRIPGRGPVSNVNSMVQDQWGFLWIASHAGLHRYDGYRFKTFLHDPGNPRSLSLN